ncbi:hypothetical protein EJB05_50414, partial [Eragrostis curvula]
MGSNAFGLPCEALLGGYRHLLDDAKPSFLVREAGRRRSRSAKKKLKTHKTSSKDSSDKAFSEANATALGAAVPSANQPKTSDSAKPSFAFKPPVICSALDLFSIPEDGGSNSSGSKVQSIPKKVTSKSSSFVAKDISASTVDVHDASAAEKAKIQDKASKGADSVLAKSGSKAKIQDKTCVKGPDIPPVAPVHGEGVAEASAQGCLSSLSMPELRQIADNLGPLTDRSQVQLPSEPGVGLREPLSPSAGGDLFLHSVFEAMLGEFLPFDMTFDSVEAARGSLALCDEVPSNTFVMSARAAAPFVAAAERVCFPKWRMNSYVRVSLAITQASLRQFNELTLARADRDRLRKDLSALEAKIKEKEDALALNEKCVIDLSVEKETLVKSTEDFKAKVAPLEKHLEDLDSSLAEALEANRVLRGKVETADQEAASFVEAEELRLSSLCSHIQDALISVGTTPDQIPEDASTEQRQSWLSVNIPYVVKACRAFSTNAVHLVVRDLLHSLDVEWSNALAKVASDDFKFSAVDSTPRPVVEAVMKVASHFDESFWNRVQSVGRLPQSEASSDISLSEFATPEPLSKVLLSEFASTGLSSPRKARVEDAIEILSSSSSEFVLSTDSDPLSPVEGVEGYVFPPGSLVGVIRLGPPDSEVSGGRKSCDASSPSRGISRKRGG